ncbi:glycosyl hydrolase-like proteins family 32 superfamily [Massariosphaeria phaeospora]|uniref:Glycosyl hydrolase-like proteins family 32 superfamily n=1 Tax=Massariosphaeria phaeospora TaxID=100035 RepID=A0A7C8I677_9PLEO|nr:glycosyl hydrolase-like proteins family 32 superfamily [Massariosphaeria phaeospora]
MIASIPLPGLLLATLALVSAQNDSSFAPNLDVSEIQRLGNNSLFTRWRPTSHFIAPAGWMNDPCGMMYDPTRETYHLMYQWHPNHVDWGNISWGHATSKDLVTWTDVRGWEGNSAEALVTGPNGTYDDLGIFSGTAQPVNIHGEQDGTLLIFYTSVSHLPTNWRIPYEPGTETQSLAISTDGGQTWEKYPGNPIIDSPPEGWNVTGWRDPFFLPWPEMDQVLGNAEPHWYAVFGSGIKGVGSRIPFYSAPTHNLTDWTFLGALWEPTLNQSLGDTSETGSWGYNFEVSNFFSLQDSDGDTHFYTIVGTEGIDTPTHPRAAMGLWNEGLVTRRANGSAQFSPVAGGAIDSGLLYAVTSFNDTKHDRRVQWGWAPEDMNNFAITQQGFQGAFALPREMYVIKTTGLVDADGGLAGKLGSNRVVEESDGSLTAYTLGARPLPEVVAGLRRNATKRCVETPTAFHASTAAFAGSAHMELAATLFNITGTVGLIVAASPGGEEHTTIFFNAETATIGVNRTSSSLIREFANYTMTGHFRPYVFAESGVEDLDVRVWLDGSLLEVHVNHRFQLTTRIYPSRTDSTNFGIYVDSPSNATSTAIATSHVSVANLTVWTGLANVFPERSLNSSSRLVFDTPAQTGNYTWWSGY